MAHTPTLESRAVAKALAVFHVPHAHIAKHIGISQQTLRKIYKDELDAGAANGIIRASKKLFELIEAGNVRAITFFLESKGGFVREASDGHAEPPGETISAIVRHVIRPGDAIPVFEDPSENNDEGEDIEGDYAIESESTAVVDISNTH